MIIAHEQTRDADRGARQAGLGQRVRPHAAAVRGARLDPRAHVARRSRSPTASPSPSAATAATWSCSTAGAGTPTATSSPGCRGSKVLFAGDLVEAQAALYTGDAFHRDWSTGTLDAVKALGAEALVGGRGAVARGRGGGRRRDRADPRVPRRHARARSAPCTLRGGTLKEAFEAATPRCVEQYGRWPIFEHCLPFDVARLWDELSGIDRPAIWTAERDREVWDQLQADT